MVLLSRTILKRIEKMIICSVCGGTTFTDRPVLWDKLVYEWQLAPHERAYIDRQQGTSCSSCGANLRSIALADAIRTAVGTILTLAEFAETREAKGLSVLEVNEAGSLSPLLRKFSGHILAAYPTVDIHAMPYSDETFDLVVHSDTLEHVANPLKTLEECGRVLRQSGTLCFTVPTIVERLSRNRTGLEKSYHGFEEQTLDDYVVQTEFGADMWTYVLRAGFSALSINAVDYPAALALSAQKIGPLSRTSDHSQYVRTGASMHPAQVVSIHFPKAAGSSLKAQFVSLLGDRVTLDYTHDPLTPSGKEMARFPQGKRLVHGHFRAKRYDSANDAYWMTFLRHPIDNLISIYFFWRNLPEELGHALHTRFLREQPSILEFAAYPGVTRLMSESYFGDFDIGRLDFIGFYEDREASFSRLAKDLGLPLVASLHENRTSESIERLEIEADISIRRRLNDLLACDLSFYERLRR
jgi:SAM-dependent methyltransferase